MTFEQRKSLILAVWIATVVTLGLITSVDAPERWVLVAAVAIIPAAIAQAFWNRPEATLTQLIERARK